MTGGLDTRSGMHGFAQGMQLGNSVFDRIENKKRYEDNRNERLADKQKESERYDASQKLKLSQEERQQEIFTRQKSQWAKQDGDQQKAKDVQQFETYTQALFTRQEFTPEQASDYRALTKKLNIPIGIALNEETKTHLSRADEFIQKYQSGESADINSPELLESINYLLRDQINQNNEDGSIKKVTGITSSRGKDGNPSNRNLYFQLGKFDKSNPDKMLTSKLPFTEKRGTAAEGDNNIKPIAIDSVLKRISGIRSLSNIQSNPAALAKAKSMATQMGIYKPPAKNEYTVSAWGDGHIMYNKATNEVVNTSDGSVGNAGSGRLSSKAEGKDFFMLQGKVASARKAMLAGGGMLGEEELKEAIAPLEADLKNKYGVTVSDVTNYRAALEAQGKMNSLSLAGVKKFTADKQELKRKRLLDKQRAEKENDQAAQSVRDLEAQSNGLNDTTMPTRTKGMHNESTLDDNSEFADAVKIKNKLDNGKSGGRKMHSNQRKSLQAQLAELKKKLPNKEQAPAHIERLDTLIAQLQQEDPKANQKQIKYYENYKTAINKLVLNNSARGMFANTSNTTPSQI